MSFISYAQNFEDVMLWRALKHIEKGFYIDVGANDPEVDSVTKAFYDRGWHGINIEPVAQWFQRLEKMRLRDINLQVAAGAQQGELVIYELPDTGLSTIDKATAERHEAERGYTKLEQIVPVETLTSICQYFHVAPIHFLKIDVEGAEKDVLQGIDLSIIRPWIVIVESTLPNTQVEDYLQWDPILSAAHYEFSYFDGLNRFYLAKEHKELKVHFNAPPNYFDDFIFIRELALELRFQAKRIAADTAESMAQEQEQCALAAETLAQELEQRALAAETRAQELEQKNNELGGNCHHWWLQASALESERNALRQSWSWRITAPVRWLGGMAVGGAIPLKSGANHIVRISIATLHRPVAMLMRPILRRPDLSYRINQRLLRYPTLHQHLLGVARSAGLIPDMPAHVQHPSRSTMPETEHLAHLPLHIRQIYAELKVAIEQNQSSKVITNASSDIDVEDLMQRIRGHLFSLDVSQFMDQIHKR